MLSFFFGTKKRYVQSDPLKPNAMNYTEREELRALLQGEGIPEPMIEDQIDALEGDAKESGQEIFAGRDYSDQEE